MKKKTLKRITAAFIALITLFSLCSCDKINGIIGRFTGGTEAATETETETETEAKVTEAPVITKKYADPLTGEPTEDDRSDSRPVAVVVKNDRLAAPQYGLSKAGILYEASVEGGMTRLLAVYSDLSEINGVGPVIDSRTYFYDFASNHDAMMVIAGTTKAGRELAQKRNITALDAIVGELDPGFERNEQLIKERGSENSILATGSGLKYRAQALGVSVKTEKSAVPYKILGSLQNKEMPEGHHCSKLSIQFSANMNVYFTFSTLTNSYSRYQYGEKHIDAKTGEQLEFTNLIVIFADQSVMDMASGELSYSASGKGTGYYVYGGSYESITWSRTGGEYPIKFYESDGKNTLTLSAGNTYIAVIASAATGRVVFE